MDLAAGRDPKRRGRHRLDAIADRAAVVRLSMPSHGLLKEGCQLVRRMVSGDSIDAAAIHANLPVDLASWLAVRTVCASPDPHDAGPPAEEVLEAGSAQRWCGRVERLAQAIEIGSAVFLPKALWAFPRTGGNLDVAPALLDVARRCDSPERKVLLLSMVLGLGLWPIDIASLCLGDVVGAGGDVADEIRFRRFRTTYRCPLTNDSVRSAIAAHVCASASVPRLDEACRILGGPGALLFPVLGAKATTVQRRAIRLGDEVGRICEGAALPRDGVLRYARQRLSRRLLLSGYGSDVVLYILLGKRPKPNRELRNLAGGDVDFELAVRTGAAAAMRTVL